MGCAVLLESKKVVGYQCNWLSFEFDQIQLFLASCEKFDKGSIQVWLICACATGWNSTYDFRLLGNSILLNNGVPHLHELVVACRPRQMPTTISPSMMQCRSMKSSKRERRIANSLDKVDSVTGTRMHDLTCAEASCSMAFSSLFTTKTALLTSRERCLRKEIIFNCEPAHR